MKMEMRLTLRKVYVVFKKNTLIRRRRPLYTLLVLLVPVLIFGLVLTIINTCEFDRCEENLFSEILHPEEDIEYFETYYTHLYYSPFNNFTQELVQKVKEKIQLPTINVHPFIDEESLQYAFLNSSHERIVSLHFHQYIGQLRYSVGYYEDNYLWDTHLLFGDNPYPDPIDQGSLYDYSGLMDLQRSIDTSFIEMNINQTIELNVQIKEIPYPARSGLKQNNFSWINQLFFLMFFLQIPFLICNLIEDKSNGMMELQLKNGIHPMIIWAGWFLFEIIMFFIRIIFIIILFYLIQEYLIIYSDIFILMLYIQLYALIVIMYSYVVSVFFKKTVRAIFIALTIWILTNSITIFMDVLIVNYQWIVWICCILMPNVNVYMGLNIVSNYEIERIGLNWYNINQNPQGFKLTFLVSMIIQLIHLAVLFVFVFCYNRLFKLSKLQKHKISKGEQPLLSKNLIRLINVTKKYNKPILSEINLEIPNNQIIVVLGRNGAGKSTLLKLISGELSPTSGEIFFGNLSMKDYKELIRQDMGVCSQDDHFFKELTVKEHLQYFGTLKNIAPVELKKQIDHLLDVLVLKEKRNEPAWALSGGMKRKLCLALAVLGNPKVLILDEIGVELDLQSQIQIWDFLKRQRKYSTILLSTHLMDEAEELADYIAIIDNGKITMDEANVVKKNYDIGYILTFHLSDDRKTEKIREESLLQFKKHNIDVSKIEQSKTKIQFYLKQYDKKKFVTVLEYLERQKYNWNCREISMTLEDLSKIFDSNGKTDQELQIDSPIENSLEKSDISFVKRWKILAKHRWIYIKKYYRFHLYSILFTALVFLLANNISLNSRTTFRPELKLNRNLYQYSTFFYKSENEYYSKLENSRRLEDFDLEIIQTYGNMTEYQRLVNIGGIEQKKFELDKMEYNITVVHYTNALHSAPVSLNILMNMIAKKLDPTIEINISNKPLNKQSTFSSKLVDENKFKLCWKLAFILVGILLTSDFITFPCNEISSKFLKLQKMAGVYEAEFWMINFMIDFCIYMVKIIVLSFLQMILTYLLSEDVPKIGQSAEFVILLRMLFLTSISNIPVAYLFSKMRYTVGQCLTNFCIVNIFLGLVPTLIFYMSVIGGWNVPEMNQLKLISILPVSSTVYFSEHYLSSIVKRFNWRVMSEYEYFRQCLLDPTNICCNARNEECYDQYKVDKNIPFYFLEVLGKLLIIFVLLLMTQLSVQHFFQRMFVNIIRRSVQIQSYTFVESQNNFHKYNIPNIIKVKAKLATEKFQISLGKCYTILGLNGTGKTTMLKIIAGLLTNNAKKDEEETSIENIGYCPQADWINPKYTGKEILKFIGALRGIDDIQSYLNHYGVAEYFKRPYEWYSGGYKRLLSVMVSIIGTKNLLILDEPSNGIDSENRKMLWKNLKEFQNVQNVPILLSTQNMLEAEHLTDKLMILNRSNGYSTLMDNQSKLYVYFICIYFYVELDKKLEVDKEISLKLDEELNCTVETLNVNKKSIEWSISKNSEFKLSKIFSVMMKLQEDFPTIYDYSLTDGSIKGVFLKASRMNLLLPKHRHSLTDYNLDKKDYPTILNSCDLMMSENDEFEYELDILRSIDLGIDNNFDGSEKNRKEARKKEKYYPMILDSCDLMMSENDEFEYELESFMNIDNNFDGFEKNRKEARKKWENYHTISYNYSLTGGNNEGLLFKPLKMTVPTKKHQYSLIDYNFDRRKENGKEIIKEGKNYPTIHKNYSLTGENNERLFHRPLNVTFPSQKQPYPLIDYNLNGKNENDKQTTKEGKCYHTISNNYSLTDRSNKSLYFKDKVFQKKHSLNDYNFDSKEENGKDTIVREPNRGFMDILKRAADIQGI